MTITNQRDNITDDEVFDFGLYLLNGALEKLGTSLQNFDMPQPLRNWGVEAENHYIAEHSLSYNRDDEQIQAAAHIPLLNQEQKDAFSQITDFVRHEQGTIFFLNGPGGTRKTFLYKTICHQVRAEGWIVLCVASSGLAALILKGGHTAHSMFKIPIDGLNEDSICNIPK